MEGQLVLNDAGLIIVTALAGHGIAFMLGDHVRQH